MAKDNRRKYPPRRWSEAENHGRKIMAKLGYLSAIVIVVGGIGFLCYGALGQSRFFQITAIGIDGCQRVNEKEVLGLSGVDIHSNLVKLNVAQVKSRLEEHSWIESAVVAREWPGRLSISVRERNPVAIMNLDDGLHYVDKKANVFAPVDEIAGLDYPVITGFQGGNGRLQTELAVLQDALLLINYASRDNPNLPAQNISEINIRNNDIILFLMDRPFPIRLGRGDIWKKYRRLAKVLYWLYKRKEFERVAYINYVRDNILVGMGSSLNI